MSRVWHASLHGADTSPMRLLPCVGCKALAKTDRSWAVCLGCMAKIRTSLSHLPGWAHRSELRDVLRSRKRVKDVLAVLREREGVA